MICLFGISTGCALWLLTKEFGAKALVLGVALTISNFVTGMVVMKK